MAETLGGVVAVVVVVLLLIRSVRRWRTMTPEQREIELLKRRTRRLEREQRTNRYR